MRVTLMESEITFILLGDVNYKFKAPCVNLRWGFKVPFINDRYCYGFFCWRASFYLVSCACDKMCLYLLKISIKLIKCNNLFQAVITCLHKFKFYISFKILLLSKQSKWNCSRCELTLPSSSWGVKGSHRRPRNPR